MKTFYISETSNSGSYRKPEKVIAKDLKAAKAHATRNQVYQGTTLSIYSDIDDNGFGVDLITSKNTGFANTNRWI